LSISFIETSQGNARITSHHHFKKIVAFITHGAGKGLDAPDLSSTIHLLDYNGISVVGIEMPWLVAGKKIASPSNQLDIAFEEIFRELEPRYFDYKKIFIGRSTGARVICRTSHTTNPDLIICLAFPLNSLSGKSRKQELEKISNENRKAVIIQGEKDKFGSPDILSKEIGNQANIEIISAGNLAHKLSSSVGELVINSIKKNGLLDRHGSV
jgi:predicted alpha/beta-hydrolase family hydrolase